jgi:K+-sensing histidine kinase KdpD
MHQHLVQTTRPERPLVDEDVLGEVAEQLRPTMAALRDSAARLEAATAAQPNDVSGELADRIVEQTEVMARWVSAMLDVERVRLGKVRLEKREMDLVTIARRCAAEFTECDVRVLAAASVIVRVDERRLCQVIDTVLHALLPAGRHCEITLHLGSGTWPTCAPQPMLQLELLVARQMARMHGGDLWAEEGASILVLPLHFPPLSHAILAATIACLPAE